MDLGERVDRVSPDRLRAYTTHLLVAAGLTEPNAALVATSLVRSNLRGHNSHGVRRLPMYLRSIRGDRTDAFRIDPTAEPGVIESGPAYAVVNGRDAMGQLVGRVAVEAAIERAEMGGVCAVGVRNATHLGRIGEWSERVADAGLLHAAFVAVHGARAVAPAGSAQPRLGTNPLSFGVPTFDALPYSIVYDGATSQVANGRPKEADAAGRSLPLGWVVDDTGESVLDAAAYLDGAGALLPLGGLTSGYKGFGLAVIAELFAAVAADGRVTAQLDALRGNAALFIAIDPTRFTTRGAIESMVTALADDLEATTFGPEIPAGDGAFGDRAVLPGAPEHHTAEERRAKGIPLPEADIESLRSLASEVGIDAAGI